MPEHLAATLQRGCVGSAPHHLLQLHTPHRLPSTSMGPENQNQGNSHQSEKNGQMRRQVGLEGGWMPEHLAATLQRVCWVGSTSPTAAPKPPQTSMGPEDQTRGKSHQSEKNRQMRRQVASWVGGWLDA